MQNTKTFMFRFCFILFFCFEKCFFFSVFSFLEKLAFSSAKIKEDFPLSSWHAAFMSERRPAK